MFHIKSPLNTPSSEDQKNQENKENQDNKDHLNPSKTGHFIEDHNFQKLLSIREIIYQKTQVKPSLSKLVNWIIENSDLEKIKDQFIHRYQ